jgi:1,4-alpha-glucan branching enzyme
MQMNWQTLGSAVQQHARRLRQGRHHDPFAVLGCHPLTPDSLSGAGQNPAAPAWSLRAWLPTARRAWVLTQDQQKMELHGVENSGLFVLQLTAQQKALLPEHYTLQWQEADQQLHQVVSPDSFAPQLGELDLQCGWRGGGAFCSVGAGRRTRVGGGGF